MFESKWLSKMYVVAGVNSTKIMACFAHVFSVYFQFNFHQVLSDTAPPIHSTHYGKCVCVYIVWLWWCVFFSTFLSIYTNKQPSISSLAIAIIIKRATKNWWSPNWRCSTFWPHSNLRTTRFFYYQTRALDQIPFEWETRLNWSSIRNVIRFYSKINSSIWTSNE